MATSEVIDGLNPNITIKSEPRDCDVDIKMEPPDSNEFENGSGNAENVNVCIKVENEAYPDIPDIEHIMVKIEPACYSSDDELDLASYQNLMSRKSPQSENIKPILRVPQLKKKKKSRDEDEDYMPKKKKEKVIKEIVKKTYTTKAKNLSNIFESFLPQLLTYPNPIDPLNGDAAAMYLHKPEEYKKKVSDYVRRFATEEALLEKDAITGMGSSTSSKPNGAANNNSDTESSMSDFSDDEAQGMEL